MRSMPVELYRLRIGLELLRMQGGVAFVVGNLLYGMSDQDISEPERVQVLLSLRVSVPLMPERVQMCVVRGGVSV